MRDLQQQIKVLNEVSNLIIRSPNCSCIINDVFEIVLNDWPAEIALLLLKGGENKLRVFTSVNFGQKSLASHYPGEYFVKSLAGDWDLQRCNIKGKLIEFAEDGEKFLFSCPFWMENKVVGSFALIGKADQCPSKEESVILQMVFNKIALSLEKELIKERYNTSQSCFTSILDSLSIGIILTNGDYVTYTNVFMKMLLKSETIARNLEDFFQQIIRQSTNPSTVAIYFETSRSIKRGCYTFEIETDDKRYLKFTKFDVLSPLDEVICFGYMVTDITQTKETEKLKNELVAIVSHELRTPLTSIKGMVSSLLRTDVEWDKETEKGFLEDVCAECDRLNGLINRLLDLSKINGGVLQLEKEYITIEKFINRFKNKIVERLFSQENITFKIENGSAIVEIDEEKIQQVLVNLIENAIKYSQPKVKIEINIATQGDVVVFAVKDNGNGISKNVIDRVFDKFYRDHKKNGFGSGLGLAICKGFIDAHGGTIWVKSHVGEGSTFYFTLPLKKVGGDIFESTNISG